MKTVLLHLSTQDREGLIASISEFIANNKGNILDLDQHTTEEKMFFVRIKWDISNFKISSENIREKFAEFLKKKNIFADWRMLFDNEKLKMAIFVSKYEHCLWDLLLRHKNSEINTDIPLIISNHENLREVAEYFNIDYYCIPVSPENKKEAETKEHELLKKYNIDFVVLARYMQVLSGDFLKKYPNKIINIHHSFLPAFKGASPYKRAFERGVKLIGATAHFVTEDLDKGPIISQDVLRISHKDKVIDLITKGRDIERLVLSEAVKYYTNHRVFVHEGRTVIL